MRSAPPHRTTARIADLLETIAAAPDGLFLRDLAARLRAPKSSLVPLLRTLAARGYLRAGPAGDYRVGGKLFELGKAASSPRELPEVARPALLRLTEATGEGVMLAVPAGDAAGVVYIDKVESRHYLRLSVDIGELRPFHATAAGKVFLAFMDRERSERIERSIKLTRHAPRTVATLAGLRAAVAETRRRGICINIEEAQAGGGAIAAPIFDAQGSVIAACVLGAPTQRLRPRAKALAGQVRATAEAISRELGFRGAAQGVDGEARAKAA
jgi:DNA-binding IclR family transcriptional regulator